MPRVALSDVLSLEDPVIEHRGAIVCLPCLLTDLRGSICAYEFEVLREEEVHCGSCKRWGDRVFRLVPRDDLARDLRNRRGHEVMSP
jgi:hypothetical protein